MGNCLISQGKVVKIMRTDGKILEYKASIKVNEVLSEFTEHALSDMLPVLQHLKPNVELLAGRLYHLIPLPSPSPSPKVGKKKVRFSETDQVMEGENKKPNLRIKLVISKQELREMLEHGVISMDGAVSQLIQTNENETDKHMEQSYDSEAWTPSLQCIPEVE